MERIRPYMDQDAMILACDGALNDCLENGIVPDAVIGDMDSTSEEMLQRFLALGGEVHRREEQNSHDLTKALTMARGWECETCVVVGATGGDRQHEWANLLTCAAASMNIECLDEEHVYAFLSPNKMHSIEMIPGQMFSLFALPVAHEVTLEGARYPLLGETLHMGSRGLHNVASGPTLGLNYSEGRIMLLKIHPSAKAGGTPEA